MVEPEIKILEETRLVGSKMKMTFAGNRTAELWKNFMPKRNLVQSRSGSDLYSVEIYDDILFFQHFNPSQTFEKWAAVKVHEFISVPEGMEKLVIPGGIYAVFLYKGKASEAEKFYRYIFETWMPNSEYVLDNRPHFAVMGDNYKNEDPGSEEELWIPVKKEK